MARTFVYSDNLATRVEIGQEPGDGTYWATCVGHADNASLVDGTHERFVFEDTAQVAEIHADRCTRCADDDCRTPRPHDSGHRCRKN
jgi:hypothetical protein